MEEANKLRLQRSRILFDSIASVKNIPKADALPNDALSLLLEDPRFVLQGEMPADVMWRRSDLNWQALSGTAAWDHDVVELRKRLSFDRQCDFRVHRFTLHDADVMNEQLLALADELSSEEGVVASNVGGFHSKTNLFREKEADMSTFEAMLNECIATIEHGDIHFRGEEGAPATTEHREPTQAWLNKSSNESFNLLHHHGDATWSGVYYVRNGRGAAAGYTAGQLLLRLTPGGGTGACEPDEDNHVSRMRLCGVFVDPSTGVEESRYAEVHPMPGTLLVFPGFLSHAVAPHFGDLSRVGISFNIFLNGCISSSDSSEDTELEGNS